MYDNGTLVDLRPDGNVPGTPTSQSLEKVNEDESSEPGAPVAGSGAEGSLRGMPPPYLRSSSYRLPPLLVLVIRPAYAC